MAALGTVTEREPIDRTVARIPVTDYNVNMGHYLGPVAMREPVDTRVPKHPTTNYIVRQLRVLYRQLWPTHGQRFPQ